MTRRRSSWHLYGDTLYYYDVWSNLHYGYVGAAANFSDSALLDGAGLEQFGHCMSISRHQRSMGLLLSAGLLLGGCNFVDKDRVMVTIVTPRAAPPRILNEVSVISGGDKFTWAQISSGEKVSVTLSPGDTSDAQSP